MAKKKVTPDGIMQLGFGFWGSKTLLSAVELGLFTELAKGPLDEAALTARLGAARGWLRFDTVRFDGQPIAFHFGFEHRRRFTWYKPAFDIRESARSPGEVLIKHLLDDAIAEGVGIQPPGPGSGWRLVGSQLTERSDAAPSPAGASQHARSSAVG